MSSERPPTPEHVKNRPGPVTWQQEISRALGCQPGHLTYPLEDCVQRINELMENQK